MFTRGFVIFSIFLFIVAAAIIGGDYNRISQDTVAFYNFSNKSFYDLWTFWLVLCVIGGIHEFGHGMACKHFGGEVHHMGFLLIYFTPAFYTDTTDQYLFPSVAQREWVIFAGIWVELVACALATLVWHVLPPGTLWSDLAYKVILLSALSGVFFNLNPLMKFDGYYALAQWLRMDNLREDAFAYAQAWLRRTVLRQAVELPAASRRQRRVYLLFVPAAFLYSTMVLVVVTLFVKNVFVNHFGDWGYLLTLGVVYLLLRKKVAHLLPHLDQMKIRAREHLSEWNMTRTQKAAFAAVAGLLVLVPVPTTVTSNFTLEPIRRVEVRPPAPGVVHEVLVKTGEHVSEGQTLARLASPTLEEAQIRDQSRLAAVERELLAAESAGDQNADWTGPAAIQPGGGATGRRANETGGARPALGDRGRGDDAGGRPESRNLSAFGRYVRGGRRSGTVEGPAARHRPGPAIRAAGIGSEAEAERLSVPHVQRAHRRNHARRRCRAADRRTPPSGTLRPGPDKLLLGDRDAAQSPRLAAGRNDG